MDLVVLGIGFVFGLFLYIAEAVWRRHKEQEYSCVCDPSLPPIVLGLGPISPWPFSYEERPPYDRFYVGAFSDLDDDDDDDGYYDDDDDEDEEFDDYDDEEDYEDDEFDDDDYDDEEDYEDDEFDDDDDDDDDDYCWAR